ncbi:aminopeptidase P family protein [Zavarzinia compransoris]|uniref:M24 family metallopeptidase n=1 Tax=Zavarzinia marina TaxID=2911065 RepID=UPI001F481EA3|nr:M24 family metallopeptidase [Zavarzinia marina]MCF4167629.1 aminopeptidase P family protein [Zavarzinia marina]
MTVPDEATRLDAFRKAQHLAYAAAEAAAAELRPGMTEREAAKLMDTYARDNGVNEWFHQPFAWFGDRTAFRGPIAWTALRGFNPAFFPGGRRLEEGMAFILDCAPVVEAAVADIGYSGALGENPVAEQLMDDLQAHRALIVDRLNQGATMAEVSRAVDALCRRQGVEPRHKAYPYNVLAHRVEVLPGKPSGLGIARFGLRSVRELRRQVAQGRAEGWSPLWSSAERSDHPPVPGLWAVEPHLGFRDVGAKFEELLVIDAEGRARWLDDDLPHVRRWNARKTARKAA